MVITDSIVVSSDMIVITIITIIIFIVIVISVTIVFIIFKIIKSAFENIRIMIMMVMVVENSFITFSLLAIRELFRFLICLLLCYSG